MDEVALSNVFATPANDGGSLLDGIHFDLPEARYHADPRDSTSRICRFLERRSYYRSRRGIDATDVMRYGSYFHGAVLEPTRDRNERFAVAPCRLDIGQAEEGDADAYTVVNRQRKDGKAAWDDFLATNPAGKISVLPQHARCCAPMLAALAAHEEASSLFFPVDAGRNEVTIAWHDEVTGRAMRARLDRLLDARCLAPDLKTCETADPRRVNAVAYKLGYHIKAAVYIDGLRAVTGRWFTMPFVFVSVDVEPQVLVWWAEPDCVEVQWGRVQYRCALLDIAECERTDEWRQPFETTKGQPYQMPGWALREAQQALTLTGMRPAP